MVANGKPYLVTILDILQAGERQIFTNKQDLDAYIKGQSLQNLGDKHPVIIHCLVDAKKVNSRPNITDQVAYRLILKCLNKKTSLEVSGYFVALYDSNEFSRYEKVSNPYFFSVNQQELKKLLAPLRQSCSMKIAFIGRPFIFNSNHEQQNQSLLKRALKASTLANSQ